MNRSESSPSSTLPAEQSQSQGTTASPSPSDHFKHHHHHRHGDGDSSNHCLSDSSTHNSAHSSAHSHDAESTRRIVNRLSRIEGHVRGLKRMVQEQENCPDVLIQVAAVRGALDKVARLILDEHLTECVVRAAEQGNIEGEIAELQAALNRFLP